MDELDDGRGTESTSNLVATAQALRAVPSLRNFGQCLNAAILGNVLVLLFGVGAWLAWNGEAKSGFVLGVGGALGAVGEAGVMVFVC